MFVRFFHQVAWDTMEDVQFVWRTAQELSERVQIGEFESSGAHSVLVHLHRRVCGSDNVGIDARGESQHDAESGERAVRDERVQEILPRRV